MHPKSSKKSRTQRVGDPKIPAFPLQRRRPRPTPATWLLFVLAVVMAGAGVVTQFGAVLDPQLIVVGESVHAWGLEPGTLFVGGLVLLGVALTSRQQRVHAATILAPSSIDEALTEVGADLAEFRNKLYDLGNDQIEIRSLLQSMRQEADQHYTGDRTDEVVEATFRVAGSLDTLHAKLDQRVGTAQESLAQGLYELSHLVEASRDFLQETLEEGQQAQSALGEEVRRQLDDVSRTVSRPVAPQIVMQDPAAMAAMMQSAAAASSAPRPEETVAESESASEPESESESAPTPGVRSELGEHHDANAWFRAEETPEGADEELRIAKPDAPLPEPSGVQQARLGLLDRFDENAEDSEAPAPEAEESPMSVLEDMERAMEEEHATEMPETAEAPEGPLEVRFDQPPQAPGHVGPPEHDGTTIVQLDDPGPALPSAPAAAPLPKEMPPSWTPNERP